MTAAPGPTAMDTDEGKPDATNPRVAGESETGCSERERFLLELEFVQGLANPHYLNWLAQNRYFEDPAMVNYLKYLQYWREPAYRKFIVFPQALMFLEMLQNENFRSEMAKPEAREMVHSQQLYFWKFYRSNRLKEEMEALQAASSADGVANGGDGNDNQ